MTRLSLFNHPLLLGFDQFERTLDRVAKNGGDGYPPIHKHPGYVDTGLVDVEVMREFVAKNSPLKVSDFEPGDAVLRR